MKSLLAITLAITLVSADTIYYHDYADHKINYSTNNLYCTDYINNNKLNILNQNWIAYCADVNPIPCGKCIQFTNQQGKTAIGVVVDSCDYTAHKPGFDLEYILFNALDTNCQGYQSGNLNGKLTWKFVNC